MGGGRDQMKLESRTFDSGQMLADAPLQVIALDPARLSAATAPWLVALTLLLGDVIAFLCCYGLLTALGALDAPVAERALGATAIGAVALFHHAGLYPGYRLYPQELLRRRLLAVFRIGLVAVASVGFVLGDWGTAELIVGFLALGLVLTLGIRWAVRQLLRHLGIWGELVEVIAPAPLKVDLETFFSTNQDLGVIPDQVHPSSTNRPRTAFIAGDAIPDREARADLGKRYKEVVLLADAPSASRSGLKVADANGEVGLRLSADAGKPTEALRRALDLAVAVPAIVCFAPLMLAAAAAIWLVDPGPVLYRQTRVGLGGRPLNVLKLRTMYRGSEPRLAELLATDPEAAAEWAAHFKLRNDPRILPGIGALLRSSSLDEIPQLLNVIAGGMSVVGPRPFPDYHLAAMPPDFCARRCTVLPGLTGLWQISARSDADLGGQQRLDEFYIDNRSLWFDFSILLRTIPAVLRQSGAY